MLSGLWSDDAAPQPSSLLVDVHHRDGSPPSVTVTGALDGPAAEPLQRAVIDLLRTRQPSGIDVDLAGVTLLDSTGVRALLLCRADAQQMSCRLVLHNPQPLVYRMLQVCGLLEHFGLVRPRPADRPVPRTVGAALGLVNCGQSGDRTR